MKIPLIPRYSAIPTSLDGVLEEAKEQQEHSLNPLKKQLTTREEEEIAERSNWMWFEFTPYEVGCDEIGGELLSYDDLS